MPRRLGQHFLSDRAVLTRIADALSASRDDIVIEIGAGRGALTSLLADRARLVLAIELDPPLAEYLREHFANAQTADAAEKRGARVEVLEGDVLNLPLGELPVRYGFTRAHVAGNLPYYITSPILTGLFAARHVFDVIVVMVQFEVAQRITAKPGTRDYGLLSVTSQFFTRPELLFRIRPRAFRPPPKVDSAVVRMVPVERGAELGIADEKQFITFAGRCFAQKRKTICNNLKAVYHAEAVQGALREIGAKPNARAEELSVEQLAEIYRRLKNDRPR